MKKLLAQVVLINIFTASFILTPRSNVQPPSLNYPLKSSTDGGNDIHACVRLRFFVWTLRNKHEKPPGRDGGEDKSDIVVHFFLLVRFPEAAEFSQTTAEILRSL